MTNLTERANLIESLERFRQTASKKTNAIITKLNWNKEQILKNCASESCPVDPGHMIPINGIERHVIRCKLAKQGYSNTDVDQLHSSEVFYDKAPSVVQMKIDEEVMLSICGKNTDERNLTNAQRLALYQYCVDSSKAARRATFTDDDLLFLSDRKETKAEEKSELELRAEQRDYKRRRQTYRAKNVHTTKRSHTEIIREVIANQMSILEEMMKDLKEEKIQQEKREHKDSEVKSSSRKSKRKHRSHSMEQCDVGPSSGEGSNINESDSVLCKRSKHKKHRQKPHKQYE